MDAGIFKLKLCKAVAICLPDRTAEGEVRGPAAALHVDETSLAQLFQVVRDGGSADDLMDFERAARQAIDCGDLLQHGEAPGIGDGAADRVELLVGEFVLTSSARSYSD